MRDDVHAARVGVGDADQLVAGGDAGHDQPSGAAQRGAGRAAQERPLHAGVEVRVGEGRGVVQGDDDGRRRPQRQRVVRAVHDVGAGAGHQPRQDGLLPGQALRTATHGRGDGHEAGAGRERGEVVDVARLAGDEHRRAGAVERGQQVVDVAADAAAVGGDGRRVQQQPHGGRP